MKRSWGGMKLRRMAERSCCVDHLKRVSSCLLDTFIRFLISHNQPSRCLIIRTPQCNHLPASLREELPLHGNARKAAQIEWPTALSGSPKVNRRSKNPDKEEKVERALKK